MSMQITVDESAIAERAIAKAIYQGNLSLPGLVEALRIEIGDNEEFAEFVANDIAAFLDTPYLRHKPVIDFYEAIEGAAEALINTEQEAAL